MDRGQRHQTRADSDLFMAAKDKKSSSVQSPTVNSGRLATLPPLYTASDVARQVDTPGTTLPAEPYRSGFRRDYARLIHSPAFRRLQGKAQLFPCQESDFYRNRMSHSLEVAQIAKSIAIKINDQHEYFLKENINTDLVEFAGLAHDLGHAPFGHNGEAELDLQMLEYGGFEGNAQTLRILARLEKKQTIDYPQTAQDPRPLIDGADARRGLNLTFRTLASILKYDKEIPRNGAARRKINSEKKAFKGYGFLEHDLVNQIRENVAGEGVGASIKTIECSIMDIADDIAYSTYDLEDAFKGGFLSPLSILAMPDAQKSELVRKIKARIDESYSDLPTEEREFTIDEYNATLRAIFSGILDVAPPPIGSDGMALDEFNAAVVSVISSASDSLCKNGYYRTELTSQLVGRFVRAVRVVKFDERRPVLSKVRLDIDAFIAVEILKTVAFDAVIMSSRLKSAENRGRSIIAQIFEQLKDDDGYLLMPEDWRLLIDLNPGDTPWKMRAICDYIAGMTDSYCIEFYDRILGRSAPSIQKQH
jgi:dGTPase